MIWELCELVHGFKDSSSTGDSSSAGRVSSFSSLFFLQIDRFVVVAGDAGANLRGRPTGLGFVVGVKAFLGAGGTLGAVRIFIATVQAGVAERAIAAAVAGQLIDHAGNLRGQLVYARLPVVLEVRPGQLRSVKNRRQCADAERRGWVVGGNVFRRIRKLRIAGRGDREDGQGLNPAAFEDVRHQSASGSILRQTSKSIEL